MNQAYTHTPTALCLCPTVSYNLSAFSRTFERSTSTQIVLLGLHLSRFVSLVPWQYYFDFMLATILFPSSHQFCFLAYPTTQTPNNRFWSNSRLQFWLNYNAENQGDAVSAISTAWVQKLCLTWLNIVVQWIGQDLPWWSDKCCCWY